VSTGPAEPFATESDALEAGVSDPARPDVSHPEFDADLAAAAEGPRAEPWRLVHLMYLVALCALLAWLAKFGGAVAVVGVIMLLGVAAIFGSFLAVRRSAARQESLLGMLAIASQKGIPLAPAVMAFADQFRGKSNRRILGLAGELRGGGPLPEALEETRKLVSRDTVMLSWVGEATGLMPRALRMAVSTRSARLPIWLSIAGHFAYIIAVILVMQTICGFLLYFIIPKFEAIFRDFGLPLPGVTITTIKISHFFTSPLVGLPVLVLGLGFLFFLPFSLISWGDFHIPLFDRLLGHRHTALLLRSVGLFVEAGKPITQAISTLAEHYPTPWVRKRLLNARKNIHYGVDWIEALLHQQLVRQADAEVLRAAVTAGNLAWALQELADSGERRLMMRFQTVMQTVFPIVVLLLGAVVFWLAVSFFAPLVMLILRLSE
jgi:protein transport protein HofC